MTAGSGTLILNNASPSNGTLTISSNILVGGALQPSNIGAFTLNAGSKMMTDSASLSINGGTLTVASFSSLTLGSFTSSGGSASLVIAPNATMTVTGSGPLTVVGGTLTISGGTLIVGGDAQFSGSTLQLNGGAILNNLTVFNSVTLTAGSQTVNGFTGLNQTVATGNSGNPILKIGSGTLMVNGSNAAAQVVTGPLAAALGGALPAGTLIAYSDGNFYAGSYNDLLQFVSTGPAFPALASTTQNSSTFTLSWDSAAAVSFDVEQWDPTSQSWKPVADVNGQSQFTVSGQSAGASGNFRVKRTYADGSFDYTSSVQGHAYTLFESWKVAKGIDPSTPGSKHMDGSGLPLLMQYALGLEPFGANAGGQPVVQSNGDQLQLTYAKARTELAYLVESSTDLVHWTTESPVETAGPGLGNVTAGVFAGSQNKYLRLRVTEP